MGPNPIDSVDYTIMQAGWFFGPTYKKTELF